MLNLRARNKLIEILQRRVTSDSNETLHITDDYGQKHFVETRTFGSGNGMRIDANIFTDHGEDKPFVRNSIMLDGIWLPGTFVVSKYNNRYTVGMTSHRKDDNRHRDIYPSVAYYYDSMEYIMENDMSRVIEDPDKAGCYIKYFYAKDDNLITVPDEYEDMDDVTKQFTWEML